MINPDLSFEELLGEATRLSIENEELTKRLQLKAKTGEVMYTHDEVKSLAEAAEAIVSEMEKALRHTANTMKAVLRGDMGAKFTYADLGVIEDALSENESI